MTDWRDTVMSPREIDTIEIDTIVKELTEVNGITVEQAVANHQAEISFKAGRESVVDKENENYKVGFKLGKAEGGREVIEEVEKHHIVYTCDCGTNFVLTNEEWQALQHLAKGEVK